MYPHSPDDAADELLARIVEQARIDLCAGRGSEPWQRKAYASALTFLDEAGLLDRIVEYYELTLDNEPQQLLLLAA